MEESPDKFAMCGDGMQVGTRSYLRCVVLYFLPMLDDALIQTALIQTTLIHKFKLHFIHGFINLNPLSDACAVGGHSRPEAERTRE